MYDYRKMSPEERTAVVAERRSRGYPLHKPPHLEQGDGWYLISAATYEHVPHFTVANELTALTRRLLESFAEAELPCAGWVVLPNHYHALIQSDSVAKIGRAIGPVHGRSSRYANRRDEKPGRQVWFNFSDRKIRSERHYWATLHYIVRNPVKHGYVENADEWAWSCIHELLVTHGPEWLETLVSAYPLGEYGDKWDD